MSAVWTSACIRGKRVVQGLVAECGAGVGGDGVWWQWQRAVQGWEIESETELERNVDETCLGMKSGCTPTVGGIIGVHIHPVWMGGGQTAQTSAWCGTVSHPQSRSNDDACIANSVLIRSMFSAARGPLLLPVVAARLQT